MSGLSSRAQWGLIIGLVVGINLLTSPNYTSPAMQWFAGIALALYVVFIFLVWLRTALFDLLLRFNRFGRLALTDERRRDTNWLAGALALHAIMAGVILFWLRSPDQALGYTLPLLAIAVTLNIRPAKRRPFIVATSVIYAALLAHLGMSLPPLLPEDVHQFQQAAQEGQAQAVAFYESLAADRKTKLAQFLTWRGHLKDIAQWGPVIMTWLGGYASTRRG